MGRIAHLTRRGAVYYWRARIRLRANGTVSCRHRWLSLRTREARATRCRAARLTADVEMLTMEQGFITEGQLATIASVALASHVGPLKRHAALLRMDQSYDPQAEAEADRAMALAFDMLAIFGHSRSPTFEADCPVRARLERSGESTATIDAVATGYASAQAMASYEAGPGARAHLAELNLPDSPANCADAYGVLVNARAKALRQRASARFPNTALDPIHAPRVDERDERLEDAITDLRASLDASIKELRDRDPSVVKADRPVGRRLAIEGVPAQIDAYVGEKLGSGRWRSKKIQNASATNAEDGKDEAAAKDRKPTASPARNHGRATLEVFVDFLRMKGVGFVDEVDQALFADFKVLLTSFLRTTAEAANSANCRLRSSSGALVTFRRTSVGWTRRRPAATSVISTSSGAT